MSISGAKKRGRGRPRLDTEAVNVRLERAALDALDQHIASQPDPKPTRPEAIRRMVAGYLKTEDEPQPSLSDHQSLERHQQDTDDAKARKAAARRILEEDR